jgi:hypothetical protein
MLDEGDARRMITAYIDPYGRLVSKDEAAYTVTLTGSYKWCFLASCWEYEVQSVKPKLAISRILSDKIL